MKKILFIVLLVFIVFGFSQIVQLASASAQSGLSLAVARVTNVVDGDTFDVEYVSGGEGLPTRIESYLINAPEASAGGLFAAGNTECFGSEATAFAEKVLLGQTVWLAHQEQTVTANFIDRLLAFVYLDSEQGALYQAIMVSQGLARVDANRPEETPFLAGILRMDNEARKAGRGLWGACEINASS